MTSQVIQVVIVIVVYSRIVTVLSALDNYVIIGFVYLELFMTSVKIEHNVLSITQNIELTLNTTSKLYVSDRYGDDGGRELYQIAGNIHKGPQNGEM